MRNGNCVSKGTMVKIDVEVHYMLNFFVSIPRLYKHTSCTL